MGIKTKLLFLFLVFWNLNFSQNNFDLKFENGLKFYIEGEFEKSIEKFQSLNEKNVPFKYKTIGTIFLAKSHTAIGNDSISEKLMIEFISSNNQYLEEARITLAINLFHQSKFYSALRNISLLYSNSISNANKLIAEKIIEEIICFELSISEIEAIISNPDLKQIVNQILFYEARKFVLQKDFRSAKLIYQLLLNEKQSLIFNQKVENELYLLENQELKVGVFLPLFLKSDSSRVEKEISSDMLVGIKFAVEEFNLTSQTKVKIEIRDTERKPVKVAGELQKMVEDDKVICIFGPVFSDETKVLASLANSRKIPIISPTATDTGIASRFEYAFQLNTDLSTRGKIAAKYLINNLKFSNLAILSSNVPQIKIISDGFVKEVIAKNKFVVVDIRYLKNTIDFRNHFNNIRSVAEQLQGVYKIDLESKTKISVIKEKLKSLDLSEDVINSLTKKDFQQPLNSIFKNSAKLIADSYGIPIKKISNNIDSLEIPVTSIDAIFIPLSNSKEIPGILSQLKLYNIRTTIIGTQEWNDVDILDGLEDSFKDLIIYTNYYKTDDSKIFEQKFKFSSDKILNENILIGYNSISFILDKIKKGAINREKMRELLKSEDKFNGINSSIFLGSGRINEEMIFLKYENKSFKKINSNKFN